MKVKGFFPNPRAIYGFLTDKDSDWKPKIALVLALVYIVSPIDFDWVPILGWIDDAFVGMLAMWYVNHATNTWQEKQLVAAQTAKQVEVKEDAPQIVEGHGVAVGNDEDDEDIVAAYSTSSEQAASVPNSRSKA